MRALLVQAVIGLFRWLFDRLTGRDTARELGKKTIELKDEEEAFHAKEREAEIYSQPARSISDNVVELRKLRKEQ